MAVSAPRPLLGAVLLLFVSAAWGSAFPLMKDLIVRMPVADLLTERYGLAALVLFAIRPRAFRGLRQGTWTRGIVLGLLFGVGQTAQAVALQSLPSPVSGFAVGCNVVMTPLLGLVLLRVRVSKRVWAAVALSAIAMAAFTLLQGYEGGDVSVLALTATLMAAALYAVHTLVLGLVSTKRYDSYAITVIQLGTIALMTGVVAAPGGLTLPRGPGDWAVLSHLALVSCALGFLARTYAQAHVSAVPTAVLLASQPLWVALFAVLGYGESITWSMVLGGVLVAIAMLLVVEPGRPQDLAAAAAPGPGADPPGLATPPPGLPALQGEAGDRADTASSCDAFGEDETDIEAERHEHLIRVRMRASQILLDLRDGQAAPACPELPPQVPYEICFGPPPTSEEPTTMDSNPSRVGRDDTPASLPAAAERSDPGRPERSDPGHPERPERSAQGCPERPERSGLEQMVERAMAVVRDRADPEVSRVQIPLIAAAELAAAEPPGPEEEPSAVTEDGEQHPETAR
ncbi:DMT family transporter [Thermocatellispora tengchongensis]|nr:DMT family transporter [Thermocatellispora tengchongensis]